MGFKSSYVWYAFKRWGWQQFAAGVGNLAIAYFVGLPSVERRPTWWMPRVSLAVSSATFIWCWVLGFKTLWGWHQVGKQRRKVMPIGPGEYDPEVTELRKKLAADGIVLIVLGGNRGSGFSAQVNMNGLGQMPAILEEVARNMRKDGPFG